MQNASPELRAKALLLSQTRGVDPLSASEMSDVLFSEMMRATDDSRDVRMVFDMYAGTGVLPQDLVAVESSIDLVLQSSPQRRVLSSLPNTGNAAASIMERYLGMSEADYRLRIVYHFLPFIDELSRLPQDLAGSCENVPKGTWLVFEE